MDICVRYAQGSQAARVPGTECARMALLAAGSVAVMKASTAQPVRCVKWADTEPIVNQCVLAEMESVMMACMEMGAANVSKVGRASPVKEEVGLICVTTLAT